MITDGGENVAPYIAEVKPSLIANDVHVTSILYTHDAEALVIDLSQDTGGEFYQDEGVDSSTDLLDSLRAFAYQVSSCQVAGSQRVAVCIA